MGIRCYCPNQHRLHVKSYLAGQRGVCPECGVRFIIPAESDPSIQHRSKRSAATSTSGDASQIVSIESGTAESSSAESDDVETSVLVDEVAQPPEGIGSTSRPQMATPVADAPLADAYVPPPPASTATADPIVAGGLSMWYVRHADGGQYGPAPPDVFRNWLAEGRIGPDSLVWREGWPQWQPARDVFAQLRPAPAAVAPPPAPPTPPPPSPLIREFDLPALSPADVTRPPRDRRKSTGVGILIILALVVIGLIPILFWVVNR